MYQLTFTLAYSVAENSIRRVFEIPKHAASITSAYTLFNFAVNTMSKPVSVEYKGKIAVITLDNDKKLNALSQPLYYELAQYMREVATHDEVYITVLTGKGRYFSAYVQNRLVTAVN